MIAGLLLMAVLLGFFRKADLFESFAQGAEEGFKSAIRVIPYLAATFTALRVLESSGLLEALTQSIRPLSALLGLPSGTEPLLLLRPLSGSASLGLLKSILSQYGPDSRTGLVASAMMGSGETVLYTCAVYLSAAQFKRSRYVIPVSLAGWAVGCAVAGLFFR